MAPPPSPHRAPTSAPAGVRVAAVDLGATSGRVVVAEIGADRLDLHEVHRFPNAPVSVAGQLRWDIDRLYREVLTGLTQAARAAPLDGIGIDSWAVDYGLLDRRGELIEPPFCYRDHRTDGVGDAVAARLGADRLYQINGLQQLPFTTVNQLVSALDTPELDRADQLLLLPDLLGYWLTGRRGSEHTNASTTGLYDARRRTWATELVGELGLPPGLLPPLWHPGDLIGPVRDGVADGLAGVPVFAVGSHDTASAVVAAPGSGDRWAYLSSGTWSLLGLELAEPVLTESARTADFTNEAGVDATVRFLKNVMGLWVLSQAEATWNTDDGDGSISLTDLLAAAADTGALRTVVDIDHPSLLPPGDMPARIAELAAAAGEPRPRSRAETVRCVLDSLALAYRRRLRQAAELAGREVDVLHVVGGGVNNALLCQLTADACAVDVVTGPAEASVIGNALVQARALGVPLTDLDAMRSLVRRTQESTVYRPRDPEHSVVAWDHAEARVTAAALP